MSDLLLHCILNFCGRSLLKAAIVVTPLLGFTWVIGILAINEDTTVFAWIFTILSSLQVRII